MTPSPDAGPALLVRTASSQRSLTAGRTYRVGRDPESDIVINDARVSWHHAVLRADDGFWILEDVGSTNGTFAGRNRVQRVEISGLCDLRLGHPDDGPEMSCSVATPARKVSPGQAAGQPTKRVPPGSDVPGDAPGTPQIAEPPDGPGGPDGPRRVAAATPGGGFVPQPRVSMERLPSAVLRLESTVLRIGRAGDNQVVVPDLSVSRYHAELRRDPRGGYQIVDLNSHNGTFVNGQRVGSAPLTELDIVSIGPASFRLVGEELQEFLDTGDISFVAQDLTVEISGGKVILDHVSFPLTERCLLGVIGPSGAGKSTLLGAMTGIAPASRGSVLYDGRDLYRNYAELRHRIGLVPQENILHTQLTARRALGYAAELRFPRDTSKSERSHRIDEVIDELALTRHAETKTAALSGGQQKRVNVALELLTRPSLLFLDEPTSGLDPGLDKSVMEMLAGLAHEGRTVIVVTHSVANLDLCDRLLVLVPGGKVAYFGAPKDGLRHFNKPGWAEVFQAFESEPDRDWAAEFRNSIFHQQYVSSGMDVAGLVQARGPRSDASPPPKSRNRFAQMWTMVRRYVSVIASDRGFLILLIGVVLGLGAMVQLFPLSKGFSGSARSPNAGAQSELLILILGACFAGALNSVREIVKERPIYSRERAAGLSAGAYLWSKLIVLGVISGVQAIVLVFAGLVGKKFPSHGSVLPWPIVEIALATAMVAIVSMAIGLLISSVVSTAERAMPLVFLLVMVQVVTTGGIFAIHGKVGLEQIAWFTPSRWGFAATASTVNLNTISGTLNPDPLWNHTAKTWLFDMGAMVGLFVFYSMLCWWRLCKLGPVKRGA